MGRYTGVPNEIYKTRKLTEGYPHLAQLAHDSFVRAVEERTDDTGRLERLLTYIGRLVDVDGPRNILVLGCGPRPQPMQILSNMGHRVLGIEPVESFVESANEYLNGAARVVSGSAEMMPIPDNSQHIVYFESVLEHVDSVPRSLREIWRVLAPGGLLYLTTTNRHQVSFRGLNGEFNVPFYNWLPRLVKECYVFQHLHYQPALANFTQRPAVHWLSFADLCGRGRDAGFAQFYSIIDVLRGDDASVTKSSVRRILLPLAQRNPWLRALALTQVGHLVFMLKRT
jgi:SAM-dependent methyltransferase